MDAPGIDGVPRRIFALWTGDNPLTPNRVQALEELRSANSGCQVHLVTPGELETWIVPGAPLPRGFWHLSCIHRADYLRAYLMHHHGGCYVDIKRGYGDLTRSFDLLDSQPSKWVSGYRELGADHVSDEPGKIGRAMRRHHGLLVGTSAFIARPSTALTTEWLAEVDRRLDDYADALESAPGDAFGQNVGYPVPWGAILGAVFQPLCLKYVERVLVDDGIRPSFENYR